MKYKIYIVKTDEETKQVIFMESELNWGCGYDSIQEALDRIKSRGDNYIQYTILPYIMMTE